MTATKSVEKRTGNVSAGTSVFAMIVLEKPLSAMHREIDMVTTPAGDPVAMVHCNNCTSDLNAWVGLFAEFAECFGIKADKNKLFSTLYQKAMEGDKDCGGMIACNYYSGEPVTGLEEGRPMFFAQTGQSFGTCELYAVAFICVTGDVKDRSGHFIKRRGRENRFHHRTRRTV